MPRFESGCRRFLKMRFLQRKIKEDNKGLYVHLGGCRLRSLSKKTRFKEGELVSMTEEVKYYKVAYRIFNDNEEYEVWQSIKKF